MSSSFTNKNRHLSRERLQPSTKIAKPNQLTVEIQNLKMCLMGVIGDIEPKFRTIFLDSIPSKTKIPRDDERMYCPVIILALESVHKQLIRSLHWKHFAMNEEILPIMFNFCEKFSTLSTLRLEDACLQSSDIARMVKFLKANPNVTDLNLSSNPYQKNFSSLIADGKLKFLTLKFCGITAEDLVHLITPLMKSHEQPLLHLNISNNEIGDEGAENIAEMIRINRVLISLNIACNRITNEGARKILLSLCMFKLNQKEVSIRRKIYYQYYLKKHDSVKGTSATFIQGEEGLRSRSSSTSTVRTLKGKRASKQRQRMRKQSRSATSLGEASSKSTQKQRETSTTPQLVAIVMPPVPSISDLTEILDFQSAYHPFVKETIVEGYEFSCRGNFVLTHLNLSFNELTSDILKDIHQILHYQSTNGSSEEGLKTIVVHGNHFKSEEVDQVQKGMAELLVLKTNGSSSSGTVLSKELMPKKERKRSKN